MAAVRLLSLLAAKPGRAAALGYNLGLNLNPVLHAQGVLAATVRMLSLLAAELGRAAALAQYSET